MIEEADGRLDDEIRAAIIAGGKTQALDGDAAPASARELQRRMAAAFACDSAPGVLARDIVVPAGAGILAHRLYIPAGIADAPLVVFVHGGGWVGGDLDTHDSLCRTLVAGSGCAILALTYRRAPEHRFPVPLEDCVSGLRWALANAATLGCSGRFAVMGESAGANLVTAAQLTLAFEGSQPFAFQLLAYPATDLRMPGAAFAQSFDPLGLTVEEALWCRAQYLEHEDDVHDWRASPILAPNLAASPPTHVLTAGIDPLRDDGIAYGAALRAAGVAVTHDHRADLPHGFLSLPRSIARVAAAQDAVARRLRAHLL